MREDDADARQRGLERRAHGPLVRGVEVAEEQADGDGLGSGRAHGLHRGLHARAVERPQHAVRPAALAAR